MGRAASFKTHGRRPSSMRRTCPRDRTPLVERKLTGVTIDECPKCGGAFFDKKEVGKATGDKDLGRYLARIHGKSNSPIVCPACGQLMDLDRIADVEIDHCTSCEGVWLDHGELDRLVQRGDGALARGFDEKARAAEERHYAATPRGAPRSRFAALGQIFRLGRWKMRRKK